MSLSGHIDELKRKHREISEKVESYERAPSADDTQIRTLKKQKLRLKEEIVRLS